MFDWIISNLVEILLVTLNILVAILIFGVIQLDFKLHAINENLIRILYEMHHKQ